MNNSKFINKAGFTLIEMIVSLGVFSVVVTTAVGAVLMLIATNQQLQGEQSVMTNLSFALDTMTREMRTGYNFYCGQSSDNSGSNNFFNDARNHDDILDENDLADCPGGRNPAAHQFQGVSFFEGGNSITASAGARRILYFYDADAKTIMRRVGNEDSQSIVSSGLVIQNAEFFVTGTSRLETSDDTEQPTVTLYIEAQEKDDPTAKTYYLSTTVTQRTLDL
jgi:prepilin-type N-terminal cleavage/methylation domain-containing protein